MNMIETKEKTSNILNETIARHSAEIVALENALKILLERIKPVCSPEEYPLEVAEPNPAPILCDIAQLIHEQTQHVENMVAHTKRTLGLLQLPTTEEPVKERIAACLSR